VKILVTGAGGFLGVHVVERLAAHGYRDIRCFLRSPDKSARLDAIAARYPNAKLEYVFGNLTSKADCARAVEGVELVFHLAAAKKGAAADMFVNSVVGARNLLDAIGTRKPMRIVLVSSFSVYGVAGLGRGAMVDESTPLEPSPGKRDAYSQTKLRQEQLLRDYAEKLGFELVILRPGVIYGPGGDHFSARVGLSLFGVFLHLGGRNLLPLTYVENCAEAVVVAGMAPQAAGQAYNVHDDDLITSRRYLRLYKRNVEKIRSLWMPYFTLRMISRLVEKYHHWSKGQLPAVFTPYQTASTWGGNHFRNDRLKSIGWKQLIPTETGLRCTFEAFRAEKKKSCGSAVSIARASGPRRRSRRRRSG
jgi:nucleoside-diphosphate-sugar epimerase